MRYWTLAEIKAKLLADLAAEEETLVSADELTGYINEGIDKVESIIHSIHEDYFLSKSTINLAAGDDDYGLPTDIYANKIRAVVYKNGSTVRSLERLRDWNKIHTYSQNLTTSASPGDYEWLIVNQTAGQPQIVFTPPVQESGSYVTVWYLRNANRLSSDSDLCDIPEFVSYVIKFAKRCYYEKEGDPRLQLAMYDLEALEKDVNDVLTGMVPDDKNEIEPDFSHYDTSEA